MLVLNTNTQLDTQQWSNYNIKSELYPNPGYALLQLCWTNPCYRLCSVTGNLIWGPSNLPGTNVECTIGSTPINSFSLPLNVERMVPDNNYNNWWNFEFRQGLPYICITWTWGNWTRCVSSTYRMALSWALEAWVTVGKTFKFQPLGWCYAWVCVNTWVATFSCLESWIRFKWWVIRSNGTLCYAGCMCKCYKWVPTGNASYYINWYKCCHLYRPTFYWESTNWVLSCKWDRVFVDMEHYICWSGTTFVAAGIAATSAHSTSENCCHWPCFRTGYMQSVSWEYASPLQVSLD